MIDGIKCWDVKSTINNDKLMFNGLDFKRNHQNNHSISGSIHKYHNDGKHNADDFTLSRVKKTFNDLYDNFCVNPAITKLNSVEFGVNIHLNIHPDIILQSILLLHNITGNRKTHYIEFPFDSYCLKVYSKSAIGSSNLFQTGKILRVEIHVNKMRFFERYNLQLDVLSDLLNEAVFVQFELILIQAIKNCLIVYLPDEDVKKLSDKPLTCYYKYSNPNFWLKLKGSKKSRELKKLDQFINEHSSVNIKDILILLVQEKCSVLRDIESANKIDTSWNKNTKIANNTSTKKRCYITTSDNKANTSKWKDNTIQIKGVSVPPITKYYTHCKGCGNIIEYPRKDQDYCCVACKNKVKRTFSNLIKQFNKFTSSPLLFDPTPYIVPELALTLKRQGIPLKVIVINQ